MNRSIDDLLRDACPQPVGHNTDRRDRARTRALASLPAGRPDRRPWRRRPMALALAAALIVGGAAVAAGVSVIGSRTPPQYIDPAALQGITPTSTPPSGIADIDRYESDANAAGHAVIAFEHVLIAPPSSHAEAAIRMAAQLQAMRSALARAQGDPLSDTSARQERTVLVGEGHTFASGLARIVATVGAGRPLTPQERKTLEFYNQPFLSVALPAVAPGGIIAKCVTKCGASSSATPSPATPPQFTLAGQLDVNAIIAKATIAVYTLIVAPPAKVYGPWGPEYDSYLTCLGITRSGQLFSAGCGPTSSFDRYGDLEIDESKSGIEAFGYVPAGTVGVTAAGRPVPLVGRFFATRLPRGVLTLTLTTSTGHRVTMLPSGMGGSG
jgi:hypothetical protein